jgi:DNA polymerase elongation subunit (family B)
VCDRERNLLNRFVDQIDEFDVDLLCSYSLMTVDVQLLMERMQAHNVQTFWKLGRLKRIAQKSGKVNVLRAMSGRLPVDLRVSCSEFVKSKANDFLSIVKEQFGKDRQPIDHFYLLGKLSQARELDSLVNYNIRDT